MDRWLILIEKLLDGPQLKQELRMIQASIRDKEQRHDIQISLYNPDAKLLDLMIRCFNLDELQDLCFKLEVNYDGISGANLNGKARELIQYLRRRGHLNRLVDLCKHERPKIDWDKVHISDF